VSQNNICKASKMNLCPEPYADSADVGRAAELAQSLIYYQRRWHGLTTEAAIDRAAKTHDLPRSLFKALRYEYFWPKQIATSLYIRLLLAAEQIKSVDARLKREIRLAEAEGLNEEAPPSYRLALAATRFAAFVEGEDETAGPLGIEGRHNDQGRPD
jgi:hypothetical protein